MDGQFIDAKRTVSQPMIDEEVGKLVIDSKRGQDGTPPFSLGDDDLFTPSASSHHPHLDATRICCVWCVAVDHGNSIIGVWNLDLALGWVLQYLFLTCGVSYCLSQRGLRGYLSKLAAYFCIGVIVNWLAFVITGMDWKSDLFNVVFQFWFIVGIFFYGILAAPLKPLFQRVRERRLVQLREQSEGRDATGHCNGSIMGICAVAFGLVGLPLLFKAFELLLTPVVAPMLIGAGAKLGDGASFWGMPQDEDSAGIFFSHICDYFMLTIANLFLAIAYPAFFTDISVVSWIIIANTYFHRMVFYRGPEERPFHGFDLFMIGAICYFYGLKWRRQIGEFVARYWFVVLLACTGLWRPGMYGRYDEKPPHDAYTRMRVNALEGVLVVVWLVAGEHLADPKIFTEDKMEFLNDWALIVFLVHEFIHISIIWPLNWVTVIGLAPVCWIYRRNRKA